MCLHFKHHLRVFYGTCFKGSVPPFPTVSQLLLSPVGCVVVACTPSVGLITNFLVKMSQGWMPYDRGFHLRPSGEFCAAREGISQNTMRYEY